MWYPVYAKCRNVSLCAMPCDIANVRLFVQGDVPVSTGEVVAEEASRVGASPLKRCNSLIANNDLAFAA